MGANENDEARTSRRLEDEIRAAARKTSPLPGRFVTLCLIVAILVVVGLLLAT